MRKAPYGIKMIATTIIWIQEAKQMGNTFHKD